MGRVLHLAAGNLYGGIETYLTTVARLRHLTPELEPHFGLCFPGRLKRELEAANACLYDLGTVRISRPWTLWRARRHLRKILQDHRFDAVVVHGCWQHAIFGSAIRNHRIRLVHQLHGNVTTLGHLERWAASIPPDLVLCNSEFTASSAFRIFPNVPTRTCFYPVAPASPDDSNTRAKVRAEFDTSENTVVVLQASRLEKWKGQHLTINALQRLPPSINWEFWLAGGPQRGEEQSFFDELQNGVRQSTSTGRVKFLGQRSDVRRLMSAADIFCQPNVAPEPFGIAFVEALYAGLPVVTTNFGGAAEIVNDSCGILTPPGDTESLHDSLRNLITNTALRQSLGNNGRQRARELCDPPQQLQQLTEILLQNRRSPTS